MKIHSALLLAAGTAFLGYYIGQKRSSAEIATSSATRLVKDISPKTGGKAERPTEGLKALKSDPEPKKTETVSAGDAKPHQTLSPEELFQLAQTDPAAALGRAMEMGGDKNAKMAANEAARNLVKTNPALAAALTAVLLHTEIGGDPFEHVANDWAKADPAAALAWGQAYTGAGKGGFLLRAWSGYLRSDLGAKPGQAQLAAQSLKQIISAPEGDDWAYAEGQVADSLMTRSWAEGPQESIRLMEDLGTVSEKYNKAAWKMLGTWLNEDSVAASDWTRSQPAGDRRDKYIFRLLKYVQQMDPQSGPAWVDALSTPEYQDLGRKCLKGEAKWPRFD